MMTEQTNKPQDLTDDDLEGAQGGNTITVQICHQVVADTPPVDRENAHVGPVNHRKI